MRTLKMEVSKYSCINLVILTSLMTCVENTLTSEKTWAGFLFRQNLALDPSAILQQFLTNGRSLCQNACQTKPGCEVFSWKFLGSNKDFVICSLGGTDKHAVIDEPLSTLGFSFPYRDVTLEDDGLFYWMPDGLYNFDSAKAKCTSRPGYRLGIYKTLKNIDALKAYSGSNEIWVDLSKNSDLDGTWGDGTLYKNTELNNVVNAYSFLGAEDQPVLRWKPTMSPEAFADTTTNSQYRILCQAEAIY